MSHSTSRSRWILAFLGILVAGGLALSLYWFAEDRRQEPVESRDVASESVYSAFRVGVAALDVEENERAARVLKEALQVQPAEPALWGNLAVAQLRLNELVAARESLQRALQLAPESRELALLNAEVLAHAGEVEQAIAQFRAVHQVWPENVVATYSLASLLAQLRTEEAEAERLRLLSEILERHPGNLQALTDKARLAASLEDADALTSALDALRDSEWPAPLQEQLDSATEAVAAGDFRKAALAMTFFQNLLKPQPEYQQSLAQVAPATAVGAPLRELIRLAAPPIEAAPADAQIAFEMQPIPTASQPAADAAVDLVVAMPGTENRTPILVTASEGTLRIGDSQPLPFPGPTAGIRRTQLSFADLNFDFLQDVISVGSEGIAIYVASESDGYQHQTIDSTGDPRPWRGVWTVDVDADGDLDILLSDAQTELNWLRNSGELSFEPMPAFIPAEGVIDLVAVDLDSDGDVDPLTLGSAGDLVVWRNERNGNYLRQPLMPDVRWQGMTVSDIDRDGQFDMIALGSDGRITAARLADDGTFITRPLERVAMATGATRSDPEGLAFLSSADFDNNGAVDLLVSTAGTTRLWLQESSEEWLPSNEPLEMAATSVADINSDGLLDIVGTRETDGFLAINRSSLGYGWQVVHPLANANAGDRRINPYGIGGRVEVRAGNVAQAVPIVAPAVHFGLGRHARADLARIIWPNGTSQAEFDFEPGQPTIAQQRLKGSCPWIFAHDGKGFQFVKDFIWRSPLGLRINAQTTAGVMQTEDWVKIEGDRLVPTSDGRYSLRVTAELWETHFFDHISLLAVDHPADVTVLVNESFVPTAMPKHRVIAAGPLRPLEDLRDHHGSSLSEQLAANDGVYADAFALGLYQGVAQPHWVEFTIPSDAPRDRPLLIVGQGWIYPTDSSLNVAIAQGETQRPYGLQLERQTPSGQWEIVNDELGFLAGKNKQMVIEIPVASLAVTDRFRLRTNMEIYWDSLHWSYEVPNASPQLTTLEPVVTELVARGFSKLQPIDRRKPDTPAYEVATTAPMWLDLEGYYTRFGDVGELLTVVDDRYVIMNAGDELQLEFAMEPAPPEGWQRDFILVGDGWVKDGDFNTAFSQTVRPLPTHVDADYSGPLTTLQEDPVFKRHPDDWKQYHTRYVTPRPFMQKMWSSAQRHDRGASQQ